MLYMFRTPFASIIRTAAIGVCHELGWSKSCIDVKVGEHCTIPWPKCDQWLLLQFIVLLKMDAKGVRNM